MPRQGGSLDLAVAVAGEEMVAAEALVVLEAAVAVVRIWAT